MYVLTKCSESVLWGDGDVVAQLRGCGGSVVGDVVAQFIGDVVAQLAKATGRHQTEDAAVPGSNPAPPQSPERGQDIRLCKNKISVSEVSLLE
jgi:hypothetical protein